MPLTAEDLLPEVHQYLAEIASAHGEDAPEIDEDIMTEILAGLLEQEGEPEEPAEYDCIDEAIAYAHDVSGEARGQPGNAGQWVAGGASGEGKEDDKGGKAKQTDSPAFKAWFGDSKVVDKDGEPLRMFHGTTKGFDTFDSEKGLTIVDKVGSWFAPAPEFAEARLRHVSDAMTGVSGQGALPKGSAILPTYISVKKPLELKTRQELDDFIDQHIVIPPELLEKYKKRIAAVLKDNADPDDEEDQQQLITKIASLENYGTDPAVRKYMNSFAMEIAENRMVTKPFVALAREALREYDGIHIADDNGHGEAWVAFSPHQIKSATGNRGTFDPNDPRIDYSLQSGERYASQWPGPGWTYAGRGTRGGKKWRRQRPARQALGGEALAEHICAWWNSNGAPGDEDMDAAAAELDGTGWGCWWNEDEEEWEAVDIEEDGEQLGEDALVVYAAERAPKGGVTINGKQYRGGMWIPSSAMASASPEVKERITAAAEEHKGRVRGRMATRQHVRDKTASHKDVALSPRQTTQAKQMLAQLIAHHGEHVVSRLDELAEQAQAMLPDTVGVAHEHLGTRLSQLHAMVGMVEQKRHGENYEEQARAHHVDKDTLAAAQGGEKMVLDGKSTYIKGPKGWVLESDPRIVASDAAMERWKAAGRAKAAEKPKERVVLKEKEKRKVRTGDTLYKIIQDSGGINLDDLRKTHDVKTEFIEAGLQGLLRNPNADALRSRPRTLDQIAQSLEDTGHIKTPKHLNAGDHLLEELKNHAKSLHANLDDEIERQARAYEKELKDAEREAREHGDDPASVGEAARASEEAGEAEETPGDAWEGPGELADEEGAGSGEAGGVDPWDEPAEPPAAQPEAATSQPDGGAASEGAAEPDVASLDKSGVFEMLDSAPHDQLDTLADHIGKERPDLAQEAIEVAEQLRGERAEKEKPAAKPSKVFGKVMRNGVEWEVTPENLDQMKDYHDELQRSVGVMLGNHSSDRQMGGPGQEKEIQTRLKQIDDFGEVLGKAGVDVKSGVNKEYVQKTLDDTRAGGGGEGLPMGKVIGGMHREPAHIIMPTKTVDKQLASLPIGDLSRIGGVMVRRTGENEYRVETDAGKFQTAGQTADERQAGVVRGDAAKIAEHIASVGKQDAMHGKARTEALDRVEGYDEPSFMDSEGMEKARKGFEKLPIGAKVVSLEEGTKGRVGEIVTDADGKRRVKFEGEEGYGSPYVEPIDPRQSWRKPMEKQEGPKQAGMFDEAGEESEPEAEATPEGKETAKPSREMTRDDDSLLSKMISDSRMTYDELGHPKYQALRDAAEAGKQASRARQESVDNAMRSVLDPDGEQGLVGSNRSAFGHAERLLSQAASGEGKLPNVGIHGDESGNLLPAGKGMKSSQPTPAAKKRAQEIANKTGRPVVPLFVTKDDVPKGWAFVESPVDLPKGQDISNSILGMTLDLNRSARLDQTAFPKDQKAGGLLPFDPVNDHGPIVAARKAYQDAQTPAEPATPEAKSAQAD